MTGYHEVKTFYFYLDDESLVLPDGWKPFAATFVSVPFGKPYWQIVARRWHRKAA